MRTSQKGKARLTIPRRNTRRKIASCVDTAIAALAEFRKRCGAPDAKPMPSIPLVGAGRRASAKTRSESGAIPLYNDEDQTLGGMTAEDMEDQDIIEGVDEDGNKVLLEVVRYFFYNGEEYVVLGDAQQGDDCGCHCDECEQSCEDAEADDEETVNLYIMKVVPSGEDEETEEFVPVEDEDLLEKLIEVVQTDFEKEEELTDEE